MIDIYFASLWHLHTKPDQLKHWKSCCSCGRMVKVTAYDQQVDLECLGSHPRAGKLDSSFQLSVN